MRRSRSKLDRYPVHHKCNEHHDPRFECPILDRRWIDRSVSHGTFQDKDLYEAFLPVLREARPLAADGLQARWAAMGPRVDFPTFPLDSTELRDQWQAARRWHDEAPRIVDALTQALERVAPPGCRFGPYEGNSSDFGFWSVDENEERDEGQSW